MNPDSGKDVSVILPTYNEALNIELLIEEISNELRSYRYEIIVVDDDSPDATWEKVAQICKHNKNVRLIHRKDRKGLTSAIREGIKDSSGALVSWMDSDLSMPPKIITLMIHRLKDGFDIAVGSRYVTGGGFVVVSGGKDSIMPAFLSSGMNYFIRFCLNRHFNDYTSGFVIAKREIFDAIKLSGNYGEYFIDFIFRSMKKGYRVVEVPYICQPRVHGKSKTGDNLFDYFQRSLHYFLVVGKLKVLNCLRRL